MFSIFCGLFTIFVISQVAENVTAHNSTITTFKTDLKQSPKTVEKRLPGTSGIEVIEVTGKNDESDAFTRRTIGHKENEILPSSPFSPEPQKLVYYPSNALKLPRTRQRVRKSQQIAVPSNHRISSRMWTPRPFNHLISGQSPMGFQTTQKPFTQPLSNILDAMNQNMLTEYPTKKSHEGNAVRLAGTYRHPKGRDFRNHQQQQQQNYENHLQAEAQVDPFYNYKASSPYEINQMMGSASNVMPSLSHHGNSLFKRKHRQHDIASIPNYSIGTKDVSRIYSNLLRQSKKSKVDRNNEQSKSKPFQLTLDVFPEDLRMGGNMPILTMPPQQQQMSNRMPKMKQLPPQQQQQQQQMQELYQQQNFYGNHPYPQVMPRYPIYYGFNQNSQRPTMHQQQSSNINMLRMMKPGLVQPSQLVVHLNLYPKNKSSNQRTSSEDEDIRKVIPMTTSTTTEAPQNKTLENVGGIPLNINFNVNTGNGHPTDNLHHQFSLPRDPYVVTSNQQNHNNNSLSYTTESTLGSYYYDDDDDDQSMAVSPSNLIYHNIVRDRPLQMMLKNATTTPRSSSKMALNKQKLKYHSIDRPKKKKSQQTRDPRAFNGFL